MKYLKLFNENNLESDTEFIISKITQNFPKDDVKKMLSDEVIQWIPDGKDEEWYKENNNGEAEEVIIDDMINWFEKNYKPIENTEEVIDEIKQKYDFLNNN